MLYNGDMGNVITLDTDEDETGGEPSCIVRACELAGNPARLADTIGVSRQAVIQWVHGERRVPPGRCIAIEQATGGVVTRYELRPDVFGAAPEKVA